MKTYTRILFHKWNVVFLTVAHNGHEYLAHDPATYDGNPFQVGFGNTVGEAVADWKERN